MRSLFRVFVIHRLHLLGMDYRRLTYLRNGRRFRLTDVAGQVLTKILA